MNRADSAGAERVRLLLEREREVPSSAAPSAAGRLYDSIHAQLSLVVGSAAVEMLFERSVKLARGEFPALAKLHRGNGAAALREWLHAEISDADSETAEALFGTFFVLIVRLVGERLTAQMLRRAWSVSPGTVSKEPKT